MSSIYPPATPEIARRRRDLAPNQQAALEALGKAVFADGTLSANIKQIIAVAVAHVTQCPYCISGHTKAALRAGATPEELMEAIWVAAEMRAGGAYAHSTLMLATLAEEEEKRKNRRHHVVRAAARGTVVGRGRRGQPAVVATEWNDVGSPRLLLPNGE